MSFKASLRWKLVGWNLLILGLALTIFAAALGLNNVRRLEADIDREMSNRGRGAAGLGAGPPDGRPRGQFGGEIGGPGGRGLGQGPGPPPNRAGNSNNTFALRRPRFFDLEGRPLRHEDPALDTASIERALDGEASFTTITLDGERLRVYTTPAYQFGQRVGVLQMGRELRDVDLLRRGQLHTLSILLPIFLIVSGVGAFFLASRALRPIQGLTDAAREISATDLSRRLQIEGNDELAQLGTTFNDMVSRLEASFMELRTAYSELELAYEKQRQFTADASHELRTPLTRLRLATSNALSGDSGEYRKALEVADRAGETMSKLVEELLLLARSDAGALTAAKVKLDLRLVASDAVNSATASEGQRVVLEVPDAPVEVVGDEGMLKRVFDNLIENALRHTTHGDSVTISVTQSEGRALSTVADTGAGISSDDLPRVFDRFYRVDAARSGKGGTGLGLAICKSVVEAHGGEIRIESKLGSGTSVHIFLPIYGSGDNQIISS